MSDFDEAYLKGLLNHYTESLRFFSPRIQVERDRSVVRAFLRTLGIYLAERELRAPNPEPVDVAFGDARFQVRELLSESYKRGDAFKVKRDKCRSANSIKEILEPYIPPTPVHLSELVHEQIPNALQDKATRYPKLYANGCRDIDILVYVDLHDKYLKVDEDSYNEEGLKKQGWRSASILFPPYGIVLFANPEAPEFLRLAERKPMQEWTSVDGLFDA
jgi:hypothetical protein